MTESPSADPAEWWTRPSPATALHGEPPYEGGMLYPFAGQPGRWEAECRRQYRRYAELAAVDPQSADRAWAALRRIDERTAWGWLRWQIPNEPGVPEAPSGIGVLPPCPARTARLARRWLTRRPSSLRVFGVGVSVAFAALVSFLTSLHLLARGVPVGVVLPAGLLIPLCAAALPDRLDAFARGFLRALDTEADATRLQRVVVLHDRVAGAAAAAPTAELAHAALLSHRALWASAGLLTGHSSPARTSAGAQLATYEQHLSELAARAEEAAEARQGLARRPRHDRVAGVFATHRS